MPKSDGRREPSERSSERFSNAERAAIKERAEELKATGRRGRGSRKAAHERDVLEKIAEMPQPDRGLAERVHAIVAVAAPDLSPKLWYADGARTVRFGPLPRERVRALLDYFAW